MHRHTSYCIYTNNNLTFLDGRTLYRNDNESENKSWKFLYIHVRVNDRIIASCLYYERVGKSHVETVSFAENRILKYIFSRFFFAIYFWRLALARIYSMRFGIFRNFVWKAFRFFLFRDWNGLCFWKAVESEFCINLEHIGVTFYGRSYENLWNRINIFFINFFYYWDCIILFFILFTITRVLYLSLEYCYNTAFINSSSNERSAWKNVYMFSFSKQ